MLSDGSTYAQFMKVEDRKGNSFSGTILWPTLNSAKTKFRGTINGNNINFEEYEVVTGQDDVEVPNKYVGVIGSDSIISGKTVVTDPEAQSSFELKPVVPTVSTTNVAKGKNFRICYEKKIS